MFTELRWTPDRIAHIARHGVTPAEVEEAVFGDPQGRLWRGPRSRRDPRRSLYYAYGRTAAGRHLCVVLLDLGDGQALPVTARDMTPAERRRYRRR